MLCHPVRNNRGGGKIVAVVELINKSNGEPFDSNDEDVLAVSVMRIVDELDMSFQELMNINESIASFASPILPPSLEETINNKRRGSGSKKSYADDTKAALHRKSSKEQADIQAFSAGSRPAGGIMPLTGDSKYDEKTKFVRRKSYGEALAQEISANPELLHVRKN
jgi:hypothetical protein